MNPTLGSPKKSIIIDLATVPNPEIPEWSKGKFLDGNIDNTRIQLPLVTTMTWQHQFQQTSTISGNDILKGLVCTYEINRAYRWARAQTCCPVIEEDRINGHYGVKALTWLKDNWLRLPPSQKDSLFGKTIYGLADIQFDDVQGLSMPYVTFTTEEPTLGWFSLSKNLGRNERFLVNPRATVLAGQPVAEFIS